MTIEELLRDVKVKQIYGTLKEEITGITYDSRLVERGFLFVAVRGFSVNGHDYVKDATTKGAAGVVVEHTEGITKNNTTVIEVADSREALAMLSSVYYGEPSRYITLIGITGTNGKTSTSYILKSILEAWGRRAALIGTIQYLIGERVLPAPHTTPESLDLQRFFREMVDKNIEYGVLEVSSHALSLKRVEGCSFTVAAFTNFSQDHLDFHGTMQEYFQAKSMIFDYLGKDGWAVLNCDDPLVNTLTERLQCNVVTCGMGNGAMVRAENVIKNAQGGLSFEIHTPDDGFIVQSGLIGKNNMYNILISAGIAYALGIDKDTVIEGIRKVTHIEGRFERVEQGQNFLCIVDYAHTEDALRKMIEEAKEITERHIITVFGCGGDRDRKKRPLMGAAAAALSDFVIVTSDNPRTEEPIKIIEDITRGISRDNYIVETDRKDAIERAVSKAGAGDTVLIAGKGHEDYQEINGVRYPFSDKSVARDAIKKRMKT
jgi:UDP-N-acetylmuramoyl-L-alanyl-D-glutamate--2,6-diaminopimelate ligase